MPVVKCPSCARQLNIGDDLAGAKVRCPGCKTVFRATVPKPTAPKATLTPTSAPSAAASDNPFDFGGPAPSAPAGGLDFYDSPEEAAAGYATKKLVRSAASWLTYLAFSEIVGAVILVLLNGFIFASSRGPNAAVVGLILGSLCSGVTVGVPVVFLFLGARNLNSKNSYGLAMTGGVLAALSAAGWFLGSLGPLVLGPLGVPLIGLMMGVAGTAVTAAVKTFGALNNPEVREAFRARRERRQASSTQT